MADAPTTSDQLKTFVQRVLRLASPSTDIGGSVIPSLSGANSGGSSTIQELHRAVIDFGRAYNADHASVSGAAFQDIANDVEGSLMTAITLGVLNERDGAELIDGLHSLVEVRNGPESGK